MPLWRNESCVAREDDDHAPDADNARALANGIARRLDINPVYAMAAYEDPCIISPRKQTLPKNVDPLNSKLEDSEERARLASVFRPRLEKADRLRVAGTALERRGPAAAGARNAGRCVREADVMPGNSPVGFRLPLDSLPWLPPTARSFRRTTDPFAELPPLPDARFLSPAYLSGSVRDPSWSNARRRIEQETPIEGDKRADRTFRRAARRHGCASSCRRPKRAADYLDLLAAVEDAAAEIGQGVHVEGYPPPYDPRLNVIKVTPDPGVIEVNIHPAKNWREQVAITTALYEEAWLSASAPRSSCWTDAIPARAAAIISSSARPRRPTARSCAGRIC